MPAVRTLPAPIYSMNFSMSFGTMTAFNEKTSPDVWAIPEQQPRPALYPACLTAEAALALYKPIRISKFFNRSLKL